MKPLETELSAGASDIIIACYIRTTFMLGFAACGTRDFIGLGSG